jgi:hypothetical protein
MTTEPRIYHEPGSSRADSHAIFTSSLHEGAARLLASGQPLEAGLLSLAARRISELQYDLDWLKRPLSNAPEITEAGEDHDAPRTPRPKRPPAAGPRHKFVNGACVAVHGTDGKVCGKAKGRPGRPPAEPAATAPEGQGALGGVVPPDYRAPLGDAAADKYAGGNQGSSGVRR